MLQQGFVQIYTGNGKGKTTAAVGQAVRCAGAGGKVFFCQFLKKGDSSEWLALQHLKDRILHCAFGTGKFIRDEPSLEDRQLARTGMEKTWQALRSGDYDLIVMDELLGALAKGLVDNEEVYELLRQRPPHIELVLTGRNASAELIEKADLVTEMCEIKHYFQQGVAARTGIEK